MYHNNQTPREDPAPHHLCHRTVTHKTISEVLINKEIKGGSRKEQLWFVDTLSIRVWIQGKKTTFGY